MAKGDAEDILSQVSRKAILAAELKVSLGERRESAVKRMIGAYRNGKTRGRDFLPMVAEIAFIDSLLADLARDISATRSHSHKMLSDGQAGPQDTG